MPRAPISVTKCVSAKAIAGFESEVEIAILILMKAGAYDDSQLVFAEDFVIFCLLSWDEGWYWTDKY